MTWRGLARLTVWLAVWGACGSSAGDRSMWLGDVRMPPRVAAAAAAAAGGQWAFTTSPRMRPTHRNRAGVWPPCCPAELHLSTAAASRADGAVVEDADVVARRMLSCARTATSIHLQVRLRCSLRPAPNPRAGEAA
jgi:hypothetical protein